MLIGRVLLDYVMTKRWLTVDEPLTNGLRTVEKLLTTQNIHGI